MWQVKKAKNCPGEELSGEELSDLLEKKAKNCPVKELSSEELSVRKIVQRRTVREPLNCPN
jgi:hypothetical protein